jgi:hypothetical protein
MKAKTPTLISMMLVCLSISVMAQHVYPVTSGEIIFSQSNTSFTREFLNQYPDASLAADNARFTIFFHLGEYVHIDLNNSIGFYSGLGVRNVGMITDESLPQTVTNSGADVPYSDFKIIRRQYMLGIPLALKLGSFNNHFYIFGGGEYEMAFNMKEKYWSNTFDRSGSKTKSNKWFSNQTPTFLPSLFAGIQFPRGFNIKFKYYLQDFLNQDYKVSRNNNEGATFNISDLTRYKKSQVFYFSLCWQFNTFSLWEWNHD